MLGIGAAWYEREHAGLGVPFPPTSERFERLEEALQICRQMWSDDDGAFEGKHYRLAETVCVPPPIRPGGPRDPDRRQRRAEDAAPGREVRRRLQPLRLRARRDEATRSRCSTATAPTWAATRPRSQRTALAGGDPFDGPRRLPAPDGGVRRPRHRAGLGDAAAPTTRSATSAGSATSAAPPPRPGLTAMILASVTHDRRRPARPRPRLGRRGPRPGDQGRARGPDRGRATPTSSPTASTAPSSSAPPACAARSAPAPTG